MTTPTNDEINNALSALGLGTPEERQARDAAWSEKAKIERAADLVVAGEAAVEQGTHSPAEVAAYLLAQGEFAASQAFTERWQASESAERAAEELEGLPYLSADEWAAKAEDIVREQQFALEDQLEEAKNELGRKQLEGLTEQFQKFVSSPETNVDAERLSNLLRQHVIETDAVPDTPEERMRLVRESAHTMDVADSVVGSLREQAKVETKIRSREWARTGEATTQAAWEKRLAAAEEERFQELLESTPVSPDVLKLPLTAQEETAVVVEQIAAKNDREQSFVDNANGIWARGARPDNDRKDRGERVTEEKARFREAMERAEASAGPYVPPSGSSL